MKLVESAWQGHVEREAVESDEPVDARKAFYAGVAAVTASLRQFLALPRDEQRVILGETRLFERVSAACDEVLAEVALEYPPATAQTPENPLGAELFDDPGGVDDDFDARDRGIIVFQSVKTGGSPGMMVGKPV